MITVETIVLVIVNLFSIIGLWVRIEGRLAKLEGRFDELASALTRLDGYERRHR